MTNFIIKKFVRNYDDTNNPKVRASYGKLSGIAGIICNLVLFGAKLFIGLICSSVSIIADAVNNFSDASSSIVNLIGFKLSEKPADAEHPYGHGRYEYLSAMTVAVLIILIGVELFKTSISKIITPQIMNFNIPLVAVLFCSMIIKLWMMSFNKSIGKKINSQALIATATDSRNDVISTFAVLLGAVASYISGYNLDGWIGLGVSAFILISGFILIKETIDPLLGKAPDEEYIEKIKNTIMSYPGIIATHDLIIHDYGPSRKFASVHVEMAAEDDVITSHDVIDNIESYCLENFGLNLIIHYDPILTKDSIANTIRNKLEEIVRDIDKRLTVHDIRVVRGTSHTNIIFDCLSPYEVKIDDEELKRLIIEKVREYNGEYNCVITIDKSYVPIINQPE